MKNKLAIPFPSKVRKPLKSIHRHPRGSVDPSLRTASLDHIAVSCIVDGTGDRVCCGHLGHLSGPIRRINTLPDVYSTNNYLHLQIMYTCDIPYYMFRQSTAIIRVCRRHLYNNNNNNNPSSARP